jgi:hypothetical protein
MHQKEGSGVVIMHAYIKLFQCLKFRHNQSGWSSYMYVLCPAIHAKSPDLLALVVSNTRIIVIIN